MLSKNKKSIILWYFVIALFIFIEFTGVYFLIQYFIDPQSKEVSNLDSIIKLWNSTLPLFKSITALISPNLHLYINKTDDWGIGVASFPEYTHLFHSRNSILFQKTSFYTKHQSNTSLEYNITTDLHLIIQQNDINITSVLKEVMVHSLKIHHVASKVCRNIGIGFWDQKTQACYVHYNTRKICIVLNEYFELVDWYLKGCNNKGYLEEYWIRWRNSKDYWNYNYSVLFEVRSENDPFVYASYHGLDRFSQNSSQYFIIGVSIITFASFVLAFPIGIYCFRIRPRKYANIPEDNKA